MPWNLYIYDNVIRENQAHPKNNASRIYALLIGGNYPSVIIGGSTTQNILKGLSTICGGDACDPGDNAVSFGTSANLGTNTYADPTLNDTTDLLANRIGTPNCTGFANTTSCMGYNANTQTLTNPSIIYDLQPASAYAAEGYQLPSTTCESSDPDYPTWLKGIVYLQWNSTTSTITENTGLVTKPCGM